MRTEVSVFSTSLFCLHAILFARIENIKQTLLHVIHKEFKSLCYSDATSEHLPSKVEQLCSFFQGQIRLRKPSFPKAGSWLSVEKWGISNLCVLSFWDLQFIFGLD